MDATPATEKIPSIRKADKLLSLFVSSDLNMFNGMSRGCLFLVTYSLVT